MFGTRALTSATCSTRRLRRRLGSVPDIFLGWAEGDGHHFYVRQLRDMKGGAELDPKTTPVESFPEYTALCGWALALADAKSGDPAMLAAGYLGKSGVMDEAIARFAVARAHAKSGLSGSRSEDEAEHAPPPPRAWNQSFARRHP